MTEQQPLRQRRLSLCVGCGSHIQDQYILRVAPDLEWHASCLKCVECAQFLDENCTCFVRDGKTYCRRDYFRLFGAKCDKCGTGFSRSDFVMRAKSKIYHIECFRCTACHRHLVPGDEFALREDGLYCKDDHEVNNTLSSSTTTSATSTTFLEDLEQSGVAATPTVAKNNNSNNNNKLSVNHNFHHAASIACSVDNSGRHSRAHSNDSNSDSSDTCISTTTGPRTKDSVDRPRGSGKDRSSGGSGNGGGGGPDGKPTRVRTVLNEKQLHTLRTCYAANPRPDALMKEQLVEMTGLSPRVIRVWFQNKRCKDKKKAILMKQIQQQEKVNTSSSIKLWFAETADTRPQIQQADGYQQVVQQALDPLVFDTEIPTQAKYKDGRKLNFGSMQGIPLIASSPVRHESPLGLNPVEVHAFAPPWKALAEFALHNDLERIDPSAPHFQQLINQMHGYDIHGPSDPSHHHHHHHHQHPMGGPMDLGHTPGHLQGGPLLLGGGGAMGPMHHSLHDPSDAFVPFLDSDDSMQHDAGSP